MEPWIDPLSQKEPWEPEKFSDKIGQYVIGIMAATVFFGIGLVVLAVCAGVAVLAFRFITH